MSDYALTYETDQQSKSILKVLSNNIKGTITLMKSLMIVAKKLLMF